MVYSEQIVLKMAIYDIRHCETFGNKNNRVGGDVDVLLTSKGVIQARSLGFRLLNEKEDFSKYRFISSPKTRSRHTLQLIMEVLGLDDKEIEIEPLLKTKNKGLFENGIKSEIKVKYAKELEEREKDIWNWRYPGGGESYADEYERVVKFFDKYKNVENMIFTGHEGVCAVAAEILKGKTKEEIMNNRKQLEYDQNYCYVRYNDGTVKRL